jgi:5-formyltetrahydrofolate cyclo-ligase
MIDSSVIETKRSLRAEAAARRARLTPEARAGASRVIAENFLAAIPIPSGAIVSAYAAMGDEADPLPLLESLHVRAVRLALPRVAGPRRTPLAFHAYEPGMALVRGGYGLMQPAPGWPQVRPTILAVPLLAFDAQGYRLGYGGGYYDSTLAGLRAAHPICAVGYGFAAQEVESVPHDEFDARLDWIVTEKGARRLTTCEE